MKNERQLVLSEIAETIQTGPFGSQLHQSDYSEMGTPVVMPKDLIGGSISEASIARVSADHVARLSRHKMSPGDIVYSRRGDVGRCALVTPKEQGWLCGTGCLRVTINPDKANPMYVFYYLQLPKTIAWIENHAVGATMLNLNTSILGNIPIRLPDISTQDKVVSVISAYDDLIATNQKQITLLEETAQRIYKEWFVDFRFPGNERIPIEKGLPYGWERSSLGEIAVDAGINVKVQDRDNYCYYLPIDCMPKKSLGYVEVNDISLAESSLQSFAPGDIVMGAMRPYFHKVVIARDYGLTRNTCFVINAKDSVYHDFLTMLIFDESTIRYATQNSVGTTMPYIRWKDFIQMPVVVPERGIAEKFSSIMSPLFDSIHVRSKDIQKAREARDILLGKLLS